MSDKTTKEDFQIWGIITERGPLQPGPVLEDSALGVATNKAKDMLRSRGWYGVGVKRVGETDWCFVTYQDAPLLEARRHDGTTARRHVEALPMPGNPAGCLKGR
jgi:hypothetical protein